MKVKVSLNIDKPVVEMAKQYAKENEITLSRLMEILLHQVAAEGFDSLNDFPVSEWLNKLSEGKATLLPENRSRQSMKRAFFESRK